MSTNRPFIRPIVLHEQATSAIAGGDVGAALTLWAAAVEEARKGPDRRALLQTLTEYANTLHSAGAMQEAIANTEEAVRLARETCGERSVEYVATLSNLAKLLLEAGSPEKSERLAREAYEIAGATLDDAHPYLPSVLETLGNIYLGAGRPAQAETLLRRVVALRHSQGTSPESARLASISMLHLARALRELNRGAEARDLLEEAANGLTASPADRIAASQIHRALASLLSDEGDRAGAISHFRKAADALIDGGGDKHPIRLGVIEDLASALIAQGNHQEAEALLTGALKTCSNSAPPADRIIALWTLGQLYTARMDRARALETLDKAKELARETQGGQSVAYANCLSHLATLHQSIDEPRQAEALIRESLDVLRHVRGDKHPEIVGLLLALANVCNVLGKDEEARGHRQRAIATLRLMTAPQQAACDGHLTMFMEQAFERGDHESAIELLEALVTVREGVHGRDHAQSAEARRALEHVKRARHRDLSGERVENIEILAPDDARVTDDLRVFQRVVEAFTAGDYELVLRVSRLESGSPSRHVVMALLVSLLRLGRQREAGNLGAAVIQWTSGDPWTQSLVKVLLGQADGDPVVASTADANQRCQARYYRAVVTLPSNPAQARADLEACVSERTEGCIESVFARHDLARLDRPNPHPPAAVQHAIDGLEREMAAHLKAQRVQEALQVAQEARHRARGRLGPLHPTYADALMRAAACYEHMGAAEQADRLIAEAIPILRRGLGDTHPDVKSYAEQLTVRCRKTFLESDAATCLIRAVPLLPIVEGEDLMMVVLPSLQAIQNDARYAGLLEGVLAATGRRAAHQALVRLAAGHVSAADALPLLENDWQKRAAWLYSGRYLEGCGRRTEAVAAFEACVAVDPKSEEARVARSSLEQLRARADSQSEDPAARVQALVDQAQVLIGQQQASRASALLEEAIQVHVRHFGGQTAGHPSLLVLLARAKRAEGDLAGAEEVSRRAVALTLATEGTNDPTRVSSLAELGAVLQLRGKMEEATSTYRQAVEHAAVVHGRDSTAYLNALVKLAALLFGAWEQRHDDHELAEAAALNAELVTRLKAIAGETSVEYAAALFNLGLCRKESGADAEALSLLQQAVPIYEARGSQRAVQLARCLGAQSAVLRQLQRPSDAEAALLRAVAVLESSESDPTERIAPLQTLADLYHVERRSGEAIRRLEQAAALARASDVVTQETRQTWARLALAYHRGGDFERARPWYERAFGLAGTSIATPDDVRDAGANPA